MSPDVNSCLIMMMATLFTAASGTSSGRSPLSAQGAQSSTCYSCFYYLYAHVYMNSMDCIRVESTEPIQCPSGFGCKVNFLQDSRGTIVRVSRSCEPSASFRSADKNVSVILNARTTQYCRHRGCNSNWQGHPSTEAAAEAPDDGRLYCWVGYGRRFDFVKFRLQPCNIRLDRGGNNNSSNSRNSSGQIQVCLLAQLTRRIRYLGQVYESAAYLADCTLHTSSVYGQNYPMFEYERVCLTPNCNSGSPSGSLGVGLMTMSANGVTLAANGHASAVIASVLMTTVMMTVETLQRVG